MYIFAAQNIKDMTKLSVNINKIATLRNFRISQDQILDALEKRYGLTAEEAARYLE